MRLALLFGSAAAGVLRADSDIDIGILPAQPDLPLRAELALQAALVAACGRDVDLVRLDHAPTLVRWQVAPHGRILLSAGPAQAVHCRAVAAAEYIDFAPSIQHAADVFRRRLAAGVGKV